MRISSVVVAVAAAALVLSGCSSNTDSDQAGNSSTSADNASPASSTASTTATSEAGVAAPSADELEQSLELLVAPDVDAATKAAAVENGQERVVNFDTMTAALANYGDITFDVEEPTVEGQTATALVAIATPRGTAAPTPNTWVLVDGGWKVSETSACALLAMGQAPCA